MTHQNLRRAALAILVLVLAGCALPTSTPTPPPAPKTSAAPEAASPGGIVATWSDSGSLLVWREGEAFPRRIASGGVIQPVISPDGANIAFTRGPQGNALALWLADAAGVSERELVGASRLSVDVDSINFTRQVYQIAWLDGSVILFNTVIVPRLAEPSGRFADDLWQVDIRTGAISRLLPDGQGGRFSISPDGQWVVLATPGAYSQSDGLIRLADSKGQAVRDFLRFAGVSTGSEQPFYPSVYWLEDSRSLLTAIPDPDLIYPRLPGESPATAALWQMDVSGTVQQLGTSPASFFGLPRWSPDGAWLTYLEQIGRPEDNMLALMLARGDGTQSDRIVEDTATTLSLGGWSPAGYTYRMGEQGQLWLGQPGLVPVKFPPDSSPVLSLKWVDEHTIVYLAGQSETLEIRMMNTDNPIPAVISTTSTYPAFDAVRVP